MKTSLLLGFLLLTAAGARAQQSPTVAPSQPLPTQQQPAATDAWGTDVTPATPKDQTNVNDAATPANAADAAAPGGEAGAAGTVGAEGTAGGSGIEAALSAGAPPATANPNAGVKPLNPSPKLNPNSAGSYDKKVVKKQNKHSDKVVTKRRRSTSRYAELRRQDQIHGIRRMDKGKTATPGLQR